MHIQVREIREECGIRMTGTDSRSRRSDTSGRRGPMRSESTSETSATNSSASGSGSGEEEETRTRTGSRTGMSSRTGTSRTSGRSRTSKTGTSRRTGDTTGDSDSSLIVLDEFDDGVETDGTFIPFNVVDDLLTFNGAFEYGTSTCQDVLNYTGISSTLGEYNYHAQLGSIIIGVLLVYMHALLHSDLGYTMSQYIGYGDGNSNLSHTQGEGDSGSVLMLSMTM